jgi:urea transport system permease protein
MAPGRDFRDPQPQPRGLTMSASHTRRIEFIAVTAIALFLIVVFPLLNAQGYVSNFTINLWGKYLCFALLAISVDLLWGYTGLLSLGQALFFALGGYMLGMHLMLMIGEQGVYAQAGKNPNLLPDFMVFLGHTYLPAFWRPFYSFGFAALMVLVVPGVIAAVFGFLAFRSRIKGVYFSILTQALTYGAALLFFRNSLLMGGNNGFTDYKVILGSDLRQAATQRGLFIATAITLLLVYLGCRYLNHTKFGLVQRAIRDGENRVLFSGYATAHFKLFVFVFSAIIASVGGALYVPQVGGVNPSVMTPEKSLEAVVWVAVGGRGTLLGPILGAIVINYLKSWATKEFPDYWLLLLGGLFILVVLFLPGGLVSLPKRLAPLWKKFRAPVETAASTPAA